MSSAELEARRAWFGKALPVLTASCKLCHVDGGAGITPAPTFLAGDSDLGVRDTLLGHQPALLDFGVATRSLLLTKGAHDGPALDGVQTSNLLEWIAAERAAANGGSPAIEVAKFAPTICTNGLPDDPAAPNPLCLYNRIPLDAVGGAGASIEFILQSIPEGSYITNLRLVPGPSGVYMEHPTFVTWPATPTPGRAGCNPNQAGEIFCLDVLDRYSSTALNLMAGGAPELIGNGTTTLADFLPTDMMSIQFTAVGPFVP